MQKKFLSDNLFLILFIIIFSLSSCVPYDTNLENVATPSNIILDTESIILKEEIVHSGGEVISEPEYGYKKVRYSSDVFKESCIELDYKDVLRQPDNYKLEHLKVEGVVTNIKKLSASTPNSTYEIDTGEGYCYITDNRNDKSISLLKGDNVIIYGVFDSIQSELDEETNMILSQSLNVTSYIIEFKDIEIIQHKQE